MGNKGSEMVTKTDDEVELLIEKQRNPSHPMYLARKFDDWTERTGILSGSGLTWIGRLPVGILVLLISLIYWLIRGRSNFAVHGAGYTGERWEQIGKVENALGQLIGEYSPISEDLKDVPKRVREHIKDIKNEEEKSRTHLEGLYDFYQCEVDDGEFCYTLVFWQHRTYAWIYRDFSPNRPKNPSFVKEEFRNQV